PSGLTSSRSCEPDFISICRFEPVIEVPTRQLITRMPGTNACSEAPVDAPVTPASSGVNRPRKISGWIMLKTTENGSRVTGRSSRSSTIEVSVAKVRMLIAQAAAGQGKEDVVEGGPADLRGLHRHVRHRAQQCR